MENLDNLIFKIWHKNAQGQYAATIDIELSSPYIPKQGDQDREKNTQATDQRQRKGEKPGTSGMQIDVKQVQGGGGKTAGDENYRVWRAEPTGQKEYFVNE